METSYLEVWKETEKSKVYLIYDQTLRRMAVEKHLSGQLNIYRKLQKLPHPYLPKIYDVRFTEQETVITEEYITGGSLAGVSAGERQMKRWFFEVCEVLAFLHKNGILHRDLKPANILLGSDGHIRLTDFDAARQEKPEADSDTRLLGTRGYAPPEQYGFSQTDQRADIYALGVTFRELLGDAAKKSRWKWILRRCTALDPDKRFRNIRNLQLAVAVKWACSRILAPMTVALVAVVACFMLLSYVTDTDFREAMDIVLSSRRTLVFEDVDMAAVKDSDATLPEYWGEEAVIYERMVKADPSRAYISTGLKQEEGYLLFGGFSVRYDYKTGTTYYDRFEGLFYQTVKGELCHISPEECAAYAPAVLVLYDLDVFDTPLV